MAETIPQTLANHVRRDPLFHMFIVPVLAITFIASIVHVFFHPRWGSAWLIAVSFALLVLAFKTRLYALRVQDRVIRLEERLRLASLLSPSMRGRIGELTEAQLIALRFASDAEVPALCEKALASKLSRADIKKEIQNWRPDYWRV